MASVHRCIARLMSVYADLQAYYVWFFTESIPEHKLACMQGKKCFPHVGTCVRSMVVRIMRL